MPFRWSNAGTGWTEDVWRVALGRPPPLRLRTDELLSAVLVANHQRSPIALFDASIQTGKADCVSLDSDSSIQRALLYIEDELKSEFPRQEITGAEFASMADRALKLRPTARDFLNLPALAAKQRKWADATLHHPLGFDQHLCASREEDWMAAILGGRTRATVVIVGAAHFDGLSKRLRANGYTIEAKGTLDF